MTGFHRTPQGRRIAYAALPGKGAGVVFLHGFNSDMGGTKAVDLEAWCRETGRPMLRFDLSGHGETGRDTGREFGRGSGGRVEDFGINDWLEDARAVIDALAPGPQLLVGSSLGGWLALLLAREMPERWAGLLTIAAAPDFTERMRAEFTPEDHAALAGQGRVTRPSDYGEDYVFSRRLFDQGAAQQIFAAPLELSMPVRLLQGTADADVPMSEALRLLDHAAGPDIRLTLVKDADHRFSAPKDLALIRRVAADLLG